MIEKFLRRKSRVFRRRLRSQRVTFTATAVLLAISIIGYAIRMENRTPAVNPVAYKPLLSLIGKAESNDNYNAYFGNAGNQDIRFTDMSIAEVLAWQNNFVAQGNASSAVGRYQIINTTLEGLVRQLHLDTSQKFDAATQDRLAIALLERRGSVDYARKHLSPQTFAANLAREWASLPRVRVDDNSGDPNASYYAGDGLNAARASVNDVMNAIKPISAE